MHQLTLVILLIRQLRIKKDYLGVYEITELIADTILRPRTYINTERAEEIFTNLVKGEKIAGLNSAENLWALTCSLTVHFRILVLSRCLAKLDMRLTQMNGSSSLESQAVRVSNVLNRGKEARDRTSYARFFLFEQYRNSRNMTLEDLTNYKDLFKEQLIESIPEWLEEAKPVVKEQQKTTDFTSEIKKYDSDFNSELTKYTSEFTTESKRLTGNTDGKGVFIQNRQALQIKILGIETNGSETTVAITDGVKRMKVSKAELCRQIIKLKVYSDEVVVKKKRRWLLSTELQ